MKKTLWLLIGLLIIALTIDFLLFIRFKKFDIVIENDIEISLNAKRCNLDYIKTFSNGKIISDKNLIDTTTPGVKTVSVTFEDYFGEELTYNYDVLVVE